MQPDQQKNYWTHDQEGEEIPEMYAPDSDDQTPELPQETDGDDIALIDDEEPVHWTAKEYIPGQKNALWFVVFAVVVIALIAADIFFIKSYTFSVLVVVMATTLIVYSRRPPKEIEYTLSGDQGLYIGEKLYHFSEFKSFGLISDQQHHSIMLIPIKRFSIGISVYFPEEVGERIVDILGARLPMEEFKLDFLDTIVRKLRL